MKVLVTGAAGFIGSHAATRLLREGHEVVGVDNLNGYYDVELKKNRLGTLARSPGFTFERLSLENTEETGRLFRSHIFERVIHLAAQAGVRHSLDNPYAYIQSNVAGFANVLEGCRKQQTPHLLYASSSSVYGAHANVPFSESDAADHPVSLYAATKKSNELMAHTYSHLYGLPATGLRFFTVYGPWGRPDMAYFSFTKKMMEGRPIELFNYGAMRRDFTYIGDIVEAMLRLLDKIPQPDDGWDRANPDPASSYAPYRIYNIGSSRPVELMHMVRILERVLGREADIRFLPMQAGDVVETYANTDALREAVGFAPVTTIEEGLARFAEWYRGYYNR